jgi:protein gp37
MTTLRQWDPVVYPHTPLRYRGTTHVRVSVDLFAVLLSGVRLARIFEVMESRPDITFLVETDFPSSVGALPSNVIVGLNIPNESARQALLSTLPAFRYAILRENPTGPVAFCRCDGANLEVQAHPFLVSSDCPFHGPNKAEWVIAGADKDRIGFRPIHPEWLRYLRDLCAVTRIPFLFTGWGSWVPDEYVITQDDLDSGRFSRDFFRAGERRSGQKPTGQNKSRCVMHQMGATALHPGNPFDPWAAGHPGWHTVMQRSAKAGRVLDGVEHDAYPKGPNR